MKLPATIALFGLVFATANWAQAQGLQPPAAWPQANACGVSQQVQYMPIQNACVGGCQTMAAPQTIAGYAPQRAAYYHPGYGGYAVPVAAQQPYAAYRPVAVAPQTPALPPGYHVGSGILGQPTIYGDGQPLRNFFRYLSL